MKYATLHKDYHLTDDNFTTWHSLIIPILRAEGISTYLPQVAAVDTSTAREAGWHINPTNDPMIDNNWLIILRQNISQFWVNKTIRCSTPKEIWDQIQEENSSANSSPLYSNLVKAFQFKMGHSGDAVIDSLLFMEGLVVDCSIAAGKPEITFEELLTSLSVFSLPDRYQTIRSEALRDNLSIKQIRKMILETNQQLSHNRKEPKLSQVEFATLANSYGFVKAKDKLVKCKCGWKDASKCWKCIPSLNPANMKCQDCGSVGHKWNKSPKCSKHPEFAGAAYRTPIKHNLNSTSEEDDFLQAPIVAPALSRYDMRHAIDGKRIKTQGDFGGMIACALDSPSTSYFNDKEEYDLLIVDSGASKTCLKPEVELLNSIRKPSSIATAGVDDAGLKCTNFGSIQLGPIKLTNVSSCPDLALNLLSVSQLADAGNTIIFTKSGVKVIADNTKKVVLSGTRMGGLYGYNKPRSNYSHLAMLTQPKPKNNILTHRRLNHLNGQAIRLLSHITTGLSLNSKEDDICCETCEISKQRRVSFPRSTSKPSRIGEYTQLDIGVMINTPSINGEYQYFLLIIDIFSRYMTIYFLKTKGETDKYFKQYAAAVKNKTGRPLYQVNLDGSKENAKVTKSDNPDQIIFVMNPPHTPEHTSTVERAMLDMKNGIITALNDANLPDYLWHYAASHQVHVKNRSPHKALYRLTPRHVWDTDSDDHQVVAQKNYRLDLSYLRVFGCIAYPLVPKAKRKNLDDKAVKRLFIGYDTNSRSYRFLNMSTHQEEVNASASFDENRFPKGTRVRHLKEIVPAPTKRVCFQNNNSFSTISDISNTVADYSNTFDRVADYSNATDTVADYSNATNTVADYSDTLEAVADASDTASTTSEIEHSSVDSESSSDSIAPNDINGDLSQQHIVDSRLRRRADIDYSLIAKAIGKNPESCCPEYSRFVDIALSAITPIPLTYKYAMTGKNAPKWVKALAKEYSSLAENKVFSDPLPLPIGFKPLDTTTVLKIKESESGSVESIFKARVCAKGYRQVLNVDHFLTYAPVAMFQSLRIFVDLMAKLDYDIDVVDVVTAFLLADLKEEIYIRIPDGYPNFKELRQKGLVLRLLKTLYGLKQSPREWNKELDTHLQYIGFRPCKADACVYIGTFEGAVCYILVYVDDCLITAPPNLRSRINNIKIAIKRKFPISDKGPLRFFLNIHFIRDRAKRLIYIHQHSKIESILQDFSKFEDAKYPSSLPSVAHSHLVKLNSPSEPTMIAEMAKLPYKSLLGRLLHVALTARPDLSVAISDCGRFAHNPGPAHWKALLMIVRYLRSTPKLVLRLGGKVKSLTITPYHQTSSVDLQLNASSDSDWAGCTDTRRSRTGYAIFSGDSLLIWISKMQVSVSLSTAEAEYIALSATTQCVLWTRKIFTELGYPQANTTPIKEDNKSCRDMAIMQKNFPGIRHIDLRIHFVHEHVASGSISIIEEKSADMVADIFELYTQPTTIEYLR